MTVRSIPEGVKVLSIGELTRQIKSTIEESYPLVWVSGEIINYKKPSPSGHRFFDLKDATAKLKAVIWQTEALRLKFDLKDGVEVLARGRLSVYAPYGEYRLIVENILPEGIGAQELALRQLKEKLAKLGYFDPQRKRPLPAHPRRIGLVTSATGAAIRDMLKVLAGRWQDVQILVVPVRVQGEGAGAEIAAALRRLDELHARGTMPCDVLVVGRGGGASDDLSAFNDESVATAIFRCRIPVVGAVGHEIDFTIADLVADRRAATPTEAATLIVPDQLQVLQRVRELDARLRDGLMRPVQLAKERLADLAQRRAFRLPLARIRDEEQRLDGLGDRLGRAIRQRLVRARQQTDATAARLETLSPLNVLSRGYSLTRTETGRGVVRSPEQVRPGDRLVTHVQYGQIISRVEESNPASSDRHG